MSTLFCVGLVPSFTLLLLFIYMEDFTWWREDMNFMFEWQEQYLLLLFEDFRRFSKTCFNVTQPLPTIFPEFPKITENYRRLLRKARRFFFFFFNFICTLTYLFYKITLSHHLHYNTQVTHYLHPCSTSRLQFIYLIYIAYSTGNK